MIKYKALLLFACTAIIAITIISCQKEQSTMPGTFNRNELRLKSDYTDVDCNLACLQSGPFEQTTTSFTRQWIPVPGFQDYYKNNRFIIVTAWNDANYFYIKTDVFGYQYNREKINGVWTLTGPFYVNYPFETVVITLNGDLNNYSMDDPESTDVIETAVTYTQTFPLPAGWSGCDEMIYRVKILGGGQQVWLGTEDEPADIIYGLIGYCTVTTLDITPETTVSPGTQVSLTASVSSYGLFTGGLIKIQELIGSDYTDIAIAYVNSDNQAVSFSYTPEIAGVRTFIARYDGAGSNGYNSSESAAVSINAAGCITGLQGQAVSCGLNREADFQFTCQGNLDYIKIEGSLANFTGSLADVMLNGVTVDFNVVEYILETDETIYSGSNVPGYNVKQLIPATGTDRFIIVEGPASCDQQIGIGLNWNATDIAGPITGAWTASDYSGNLVATADPLVCE